MALRRERMRARGPRATHALVQMLREQVGLLIGATDHLAADVRVVATRTQALASNMKVLGKMVNALGDVVDDHEARLLKLEKRR